MPGLSDDEIAEILGWASEEVKAIRRKYVTAPPSSPPPIARLERNAR